MLPAVPAVTTLALIMKKHRALAVPIAEILFPVSAPLMPLFDTEFDAMEA